MNPKTYNFFPIEVVEYQNEPCDYTSTIEFLRSETFKEHKAFSSVRDIHEDERYADVFKFVNECLEDYRVRYGYDCDKFEVSSSWANYSEPYSSMGHEFHRHSMAFLSGVYYFTHGAPICFEDPVTPRIMNQLEVLRKDGYSPFSRIDPAPGKLILFPSWLYHWTIPHNEDYERWNIAFNVLPTGKINFNMATDSTAVIEIKKSCEK